VRLGARVLYRRADIDRFIAENVRGSRNDPTVSTASKSV
jgi:hypothetical protein